MATTRTEHYRKRWNALKTERSSMYSYWQELSDNIIGHRGRFLVSDRNKAKRNTRILNNTGKLAARTLASGMMAGITSPARPWFKLATPSPELMKSSAVKLWLHDTERRMREVFAQSNLYNVLHSNYQELGVFGIGTLGLYRDWNNVIRAVSYTAGSYALAANGKGQIDTFYREYQMTVAALVTEFGIENVSQSVKQNWERGNTESWVDVLHIIEPNDDRDMQSPLAKDKAYRSVYMEVNQAKHEKFLRESGFDYFPIMAPRWDVVGQDVYASACPGMDALGDIKALQLHEKRKSQAIDKLVDPPLQAPVSLRNQIQGGGFMPGEVEFVSDMSQGGIKSIYDIRPDINALVADIKEDEYRVKRAFYEDMFLMLAGSDRRQITAREVEEKHEEKLLMLGSVLERLHNELLDPIIKSTFEIMQKVGMLSNPPDEINETELKVEYISVLAQAQRLTAVQGIERVAGYVANISQVFPEARHKFDSTQSVDEYAEAVGISPAMIRDDEEVDQLIQGEQQQAAAQQQQMAVSEGAETAKTLADTKMEDVNALTKAMGLA